ncbi:NUDIX hydrolase [Primorskyibacter flagellatus]|uniref:8-oxo-dGTP diphosphatase n=1 Tax=Primorskyibacter flagellatus TaxID=1387277 RepID=A0A1W2ER80_9RHOB|nr:NUDIX hydrolase [Primorskyibacter flagellatus]SMD12042.1 8-oxo-dGTP diphosphatase [Primorskyibacter flagellatus]
MSYKYKHPRPSVTTDILVFSIRNKRLQILLVQRGIEPFKDQWAIPGGFLKMDEDLSTCAARELREETGVTDLASLPLTQFHTYGAVNRDPRGRTISVAFFTLVPSDQLTVRGTSDARDARWFPLDDLPILAFDHSRIVEDGRANLARLVDPEIVDSAKVVFDLLPATFSLSEAQTVFEILRGEKLDKRNFRKWFSGTWTLQETGETTRGPGRPALLYRLVHKTA